MKTSGNAWANNKALWVLASPPSSSRRVSRKWVVATVTEEVVAEPGARAPLRSSWVGN